MDKVVVKRFGAPDERREFEKGCFELLHVGPMTLGRARYEPGWRWSQHVAPGAGTPSCAVEHVGFVISGRAMVRMDGSGQEVVLEPGDLFHVPPGHDSWVVGDAPYVSLHLMGAERYGARARGKGGKKKSRARKPVRKPARPPRRPAVSRRKR
jgi:quercetin dioxygenase-like cupin family protein